jgi:hypothetical protein
MNDKELQRAIIRRTRDAESRSRVPMFTQRHYIKVARLLREERPIDLDDFEKPRDSDDPDYRKAMLEFDTQALWPLAWGPNSGQWNDSSVSYGKLHAWLCISQGFVELFKKDSEAFDEKKFIKVIMGV